MENKNTIKFDPGFAPIIIDSIGQVGYTYYMFSAVKNVKIKRQNFMTVSIKLEKFLKENVSFYLGCLLWAGYICLFDKEIEGNKLLGEETSEEEYTSEINFLIDFIEKQYPRDYKYFKNKNYEPDKRYLPILKAYKEFLILNNGFVNCSRTSQVVMPSCLKKITQKDGELIYNKIQAAISSKNLKELLDCFDLLF